MSFIKNFLHGFSSPKILSSFLVAILLAPALFFAIPARKADAFLGLGDIVVDPTNLIQNTISAAANPVSAAGATINSVNSTAFNLKTFLLDGIAVALARGIVQQLTAQTVNWINTGFNGNPAYVTDPQQFFLNLSDQTVINALGASNSKVSGTILRNICSPFQPQIRLALVQQYLNTSQNQVPQCSLQSTVKNYQGFIDNIQNGGWDGWFAITQNTQNNPYGAYVQAQDSLTLQIANQNQTYKDQLTQSGGFLSYQKCTLRASATAGVNTSNGGTTGTTLTGSAAITGTTQTVCDKYAPLDNTPNSGKCIQSHEVTNDSSGSQIGINTVNQADTAGNTGSCLRSETVTPGSVIRDQLGKSLGSTWDQLNLTNSINQIVSALMTEGIKGIFGGIQGGLRGLSDSGQSNNASLVSQLMAGSPASDAQNASTTASIYGNVPSSLTGAIGTSTNGFLPSIDENAIKDQINQQAAALQTQANQTSGGTVSSNLCTYTDVHNQTITTDSLDTQGCANVDGTFFQNATTTNTTGGISSTNASVCTATSTTQALNIAGLQGYNANTQAYTTSIFANNYLIVYGAGFNPACDTVSVGNFTYTPTYVSSTQLNVLLGAAKGDMSVTVSSAAGNSNSKTITVQ